jgi:hypothetical protein
MGRISMLPTLAASSAFNCVADCSKLTASGAKRRHDPVYVSADILEPAVELLA